MRLIAKEIAVLLARMDTHPEEFAVEDPRNGRIKWHPFLPRGIGFDNFNLFEKFLVRRKYRKTVAAFDRRRAYAEILKRLMADSNKKQSEEEITKQETKLSLQKARLERLYEEQKLLEDMKHKLKVGDIVC